MQVVASGWSRLVSVWEDRGDRFNNEHRSYSGHKCATAMPGACMLWPLAGRPAVASACVQQVSQLLSRHLAEEFLQFRTPL